MIFHDFSPIKREVSYFLYRNDNWSVESNKECEVVVKELHFTHMKKERNKLRLPLKILEQEDRRLADSLEMLDDASSNIYGQIIETTKAPQKILAPH